MTSHPRPAQLHQKTPQTLVARLADALLALQVARGVRRRHEAHQSSQLLAVADRTPCEDFLNQHPGAADADAAQPKQAITRTNSTSGVRSSLIRRFISVSKAS